MKPKLNFLMAVFFLITVVAGMLDTDTSTVNYFTAEIDSPTMRVQAGMVIDYHIESPHPIPDGWTQTYTFPGAQFVRLHFSEFYLADEDKLLVSNLDGSQVWEYTGRGNNGNGDFWSFAINGADVTLTLMSASGDSYGFRLDEVGYGTISLETSTPMPEIVINTDGREDVACHMGDAIVAATEGSIARLLFTVKRVQYLCTGELVRGTQDNMLITNAHCLSDQKAVNTLEATFNYQYTTCGGETVDEYTSFAGGTFLVTNAERYNRRKPNTGLDYTLLTLQTNTWGSPEVLFGELIPVTAVYYDVNNPINLIQHPMGRPKEIGYWEDADFATRCHIDTIAQTYATSYPGSQIGYACDSEDGSSGSAIIDGNSGYMIGLHHYGGVSTTLNAATMISYICDAASTYLECDPYPILPAEDRIELVSIGFDGTQANNNSDFSRVSPDGRYVTFWSDASNLVINDLNGARDIFLYDRQTDTTELISVTSDGLQGNFSSERSIISNDNRYVAFMSWSCLTMIPFNPAQQCTNQVYLRDRQMGTTEMISVSSDEQVANNQSNLPAISADGRYVAFHSWASNLAPGDTNNTYDIFLRDRLLGTTDLISVSSDGIVSDGFSQWISITPDGRYVAFDSWATNLVPGDTNGTRDVYVRDRETGITEIVSITSDRSPGNGESFWPAISADGRYVAFNSWASDLVVGDTNNYRDVFVYDRLTGQTQRVSLSNDGLEGNESSNTPSISADGRYVSFWSYASNLVPNDNNGFADAFVYDRQAGQLELISVTTDGTQANAEITSISISANGEFVTVWSSASTLVNGDTNNVVDVFVINWWVGLP